MSPATCRRGKVKIKTLANLHSVFCSIQGEGVFLGAPQIFLRFAGCNLNCYYCDTPDALTAKPLALIEQTPFSGIFNKTANPLTPDYLLKQIFKLQGLYPAFHSLSLTGGEPLLHADFLKEFLPRIKRKGLLVFLETNGTLPDELNKIIRWVDIVSMDIKTPSTTVRTIDWSATAQFLKSAHASSAGRRRGDSRKTLYVKVLVGTEVNLVELKRIRSLVGSVSSDIPVVLQSIWSRRGGTFLQPLLIAARLFRVNLSDVRIIPQMHKLMHWQ
jgi:7-carboxy-7-deazaguanine synthase